MASILKVDKIRGTGLDSDTMSLDVSGNITMPKNVTFSGTVTGDNGDKVLIKEIDEIIKANKTFLSLLIVDGELSQIGDNDSGRLFYFSFNEDEPLKMKWLVNLIENLLLISAKKNGVKFYFDKKFFIRHCNYLFI